MQANLCSPLQTNLTDYNSAMIYIKIWKSILVVMQRILRVVRQRIYTNDLMSRMMSVPELYLYTNDCFRCQSKGLLGSAYAYIFHWSQFGRLRSHQCSSKLNSSEGGPTVTFPIPGKTSSRSFFRISKEAAPASSTLECPSSPAV
jgi:hypothetical protein